MTALSNGFYTSYSESKNLSLRLERVCPKRLVQLYIVQTRPLQTLFNGNSATSERSTSGGKREKILKNTGGALLRLMPCIQIERKLYHFNTDLPRNQSVWVFNSSSFLFYLSLYCQTSLTFNHE